MKIIKRKVLVIMALTLLVVGLLPAMLPARIFADGGQAANKTPTKVSISPISNAEVNKKFTIEATLTDDAGNPLSDKALIITVNGSALTNLPNTNGQGKIAVEYTPRDNTPLVIKAVYLSSPDEAYAACEGEITVNAVMTKSVITLQPDRDAYYVGDSATISGSLADAQGQPIMFASLSLSVNNTTVQPDPAIITDESGEFTYTISNLSAGTHTVSATFEGITNAIEGSSTSTQLDVDYPINISADDVTIGDDVVIYGTAKDFNGDPLADGTTITINIGGEESKTATVGGGNGGFSLIYTSTSAGTFPISAVSGQFTSNNAQFTVEPFRADVYVKSGTYPKTEYDGEPIVLSIDRNGVQDETYTSYQWSKDGVEIPRAAGGKNRDLPVTFCTECGEYTCKVVYRGQYEVTTDPITVAFDKRKITVKPDDVEREYDGTPLTSTACSVVSATQLADGEDMQVTTQGSQTYPGTSANKITKLTITKSGQMVYTSDSTDSYYPSNNYDVTLQDGSLTVNKRNLGTGEQYARGVSVTKPADVLYDAQEHNPKITVTVDLTGDGSLTTLVEGTDYDLKRTDNVSAGTSVVEITGKGSYTGNIVTTFKINKRKIAASSSDLEKDYDKTPLTGSGDVTALYGLKTDADASLGLDGLVTSAGHRVAGVKWTGSQMDAGSSENTFELVILDKDGNDVSANYELDATSSHVGTLTVNPIPDVITVTKKLEGYSLDEMFDPEQDVKREGSGALTFKYYEKANDGSYTQLEDVPTQPGTYYMKIFEDAQGNYIASESDYIPFTILKRPSGSDPGVDGSAEGDDKNDGGKQSSEQSNAKRAVANTSTAGTTSTAAKTTATPKTGDESNVALCLTLAITSLLSLGTARRLRQ